MVEKDLELLEQNLVKKGNILEQLHELCDKQMLLLESPSMLVEGFDDNMDEQDKQIQVLNMLNDEMDELYERLYLEEFTSDGPYATQIGRLRAMLSRIMDKTDSLFEKEQHNRKKLEEYFRNERRSLGTGRRSSKAALDYYKSMNRSNVMPPQFMDQKK